MKALTLMHYNNDALLSFLYARIAEQVKSLQTQVEGGGLCEMQELLSVLWTIASRRKDEV